MKQTQSKLCSSWVNISIVSGSAAVLSMSITWAGLSISPDSVSYLNAAENLIGGKGLTVSYTVDEPIPLRHFPPLYSIVVGSIAFLFDTSVTSAARWLNVGLFAATVLVAGFLVRACTQSVPAACVGSLIFLSSPQLLANYSWALSEPLFLLLSLLGLLLLGKTYENGSYRLLVCTSVLFGLAFLTRYVGIALIMTGIGVLLARALSASPGRDRRKSVTNAAILLIVGTLPMFVWMSSIRNTDPGLVGREFAFHAALVQRLPFLGRTLGKYALPVFYSEVDSQLLRDVKEVTLISVALVTLLTLLSMVRDWAAGSSTSVLRETPIHVKVLGFFAILYSLVVLMAMLFSDAHTLPDTRILLPIYCCALVLAIFLLFRVYSSGVGSAPWKIGLWLLLMTSLLLQPIAGIIWAANNANDPKGYLSKRWKNSPLIEMVEELPRETPIFSNLPDAILFVTGRSAAWIPRKFSFSSGRPNPLYEPEIAAMRTILVDGGVMVMFDRVKRDRLAPLSDLENRLDLYSVASTKDGQIFRADG